MESNMDDSTKQKPSGLGISDYEETRQTSTIRSDNPVDNKSLENAPSNTPSAKATNPGVGEDNSLKDSKNFYNRYVI